MPLYVPTHLDKWRTIASAYAVSGVASKTGNTSESTLITVTLPAGTMGANGGLRVWTSWSYPNNGNNKICRVKFGGTTVRELYNTTSVDFTDLIQIFNQNDVAKQYVPNISYVLLNPNTGAHTDATVNTAAAVDITITAQLGSGTDTLILEGYTVEVLTRA